MKYFTNSPLEKMMIQVPNGKQDYVPAPPLDQKKKEHKVHNLIIVQPKHNHKTGGQYE